MLDLSEYSLKELLAKYHTKDEVSDIRKLVLGGVDDAEAQSCFKSVTLEFISLLEALERAGINENNIEAVAGWVKSVKEGKSEMMTQLGLENRFRLAQRFLVTGVRLDNGERIQGYPIVIDAELKWLEICVVNSVTIRSRNHEKETERGCCYAVDWDTVEFVVIELKYFRDDIWMCPNCEVHYTKEEVLRYTLRRDAYCMCCGQRISVQEARKELHK